MTAQDFLASKEHIWFTEQIKGSPIYKITQKELEELLEEYREEVKNFNQPAKLKQAHVKKSVCQCKEFKPMYINSKICRLCGERKS